MRNPLSAVLQCADSIVASLNQISTLLSRHLFPSDAQNVIAAVQEERTSSMDAIQTIIACSVHQKSVIDDILTLSKVGY